MPNFFCFLLFLLPSLPLLAQSADLSKGYVVLENGDTLKGEMRYRSRDGLKDKIYLKISETEKKYLPIMDLKAFQADSLQYQKIELRKKQVFVKLLASGAIELVEEEFLRDYQGQSLPAFRLYFKTTATGSWEEVKTNGNRWREQMSEAMKSRPETAEMLQNKQLTPDDLGKIVRQFNAPKN